MSLTCSWMRSTGAFLSSSSRSKYLISFFEQLVKLLSFVSYATVDRKYQFVFLTPLNTDNIDVGDDLKIIKLRKTI